MTDSPGKKGVLLDKLYFSVYTFMLEVTEDMILTDYKGSTFRGGFGSSFKQLVCISRKTENCQECLVHEGCSFFKIFTSHADNQIMKRLNITHSAPRPYILEPPSTTRRKFITGELIQFNLILVGWAREYLPYFIIVFEQLGMRLGVGKITSGKRGKFKVLSVRSGEKEIYAGDAKNIIGKGKKISIHNFTLPPTCSKLELHFITPTRLEYKDKRIKIQTSANVKTLFIRLFSRLFRLQELYCQGYGTKYSNSLIEGMAEKVHLKSSRLSWYDLKRPLNLRDKSTTLDEKEWMNYGGFIGEITLTGELGALLPLLKLGEYLHVGKYYTFGLGKYEILSFS